MSILDSYDEIMSAEPIVMTTEKLAVIDDVVSYYIDLTKNIRKYQDYYERAHRELNAILEHELECKRVLDIATDAAKKCTADQKVESTKALYNARLDYDSAMSDTKRVHELMEKLSNCIYNLKLAKAYIRQFSFGNQIS